MSQGSARALKPTTVHEATYEVLRSLGMTTIFGNPGSNELPFIDHMPSDFRYIFSNRRWLLSSERAAIEPARISFPTQHPNFLGTLGTPIAAVRKQLTGHDLVIVFGAPVFRYHAWTPGSYLPDGTHVVMITADPDQAARAPMGDAIVGEPVVAMEQLQPLVKPKPAKLPARKNTPVSCPPENGKITVKQFDDVLAQVCPPDAAFTSESPSLGNWWEQVSLTRPRCFFCGAGGALGFALPAAVGASLAFGNRPVIALVGDGSANYSITGLWTAAQQKVPCTFVIVRNGVYEALKDYGVFLSTPDLPGMNLPGIDFVSLAAGYGVPGRRVSNAVEMADALKVAIDTGKPSLLEVELEAADSGMFGPNAVTGPSVSGEPGLDALPTSIVLVSFSSAWLSRPPPPARATPT
jgi:benzoylformate decarboxylase